MQQDLIIPKAASPWTQKAQGFYLGNSLTCADVGTVLNTLSLRSYLFIHHMLIKRKNGSPQEGDLGAMVSKAGFRSHKKGGA